MRSLIEISRHSHYRELAIVTGPAVASLNYRNAKGIPSTLDLRRKSRQITGKVPPSTCMNGSVRYLGERMVV